MSRNHPKDAPRTIRRVYGRLPRNPVLPVDTRQDAALWARMEGPLTPASVPMPASGTTCRQLDADAAAFARAGRKGQAPVFLFVFSGFGMRIPLDGLTPCAGGPTLLKYSRPRRRRQRTRCRHGRSRGLVSGSRWGGVEVQARVTGATVDSAVSPVRHRVPRPRVPGPRCRPVRRD